MSEVQRLAADRLHSAPSLCAPVAGEAGGAQEAGAGPEPLSTPAAGIRRRALEEQLPSWLLRAGLAFALSYAATSSFFHPETFAHYFPSFLPRTWATELLPVFAVFEMLLAVGLMTDRWTYLAAMLAGLTLIAIIVVNPDAFDVLFRNVAIACGAFALALQSRREHARDAARRGARRRWRRPTAARTRTG